MLFSLLVETPWATTGKESNKKFNSKMHLSGGDLLGYWGG